MIGLFSLTAGALAQASPERPPPPGSPLPRVLPPTVPDLSPGLPPAVGTPRIGTPGMGTPGMGTPGIGTPPSEGPSTATTDADTPEGGVVTVREIEFEGTTAYPEQTLRGLVGELVGPAVPRAAIEDARLGILDRYRGDGAVFTTVTAQLRGPRLIFVVIEGYIADVEIDGDVGPVRAQISRFLEHLLQERPLKAASLERWMLLVTDIPGIAARAVLRPSSTEPGALTLIAQVARRTLTGLALFDNRAYQFTGPSEGLVTADINSLTSYGERTTLSLLHSFDGTQIFGQASTELFVGASGLRLRLSGGAGDTRPNGPLRQIDYAGFTTVFGAQLSYPLIRERQRTLNVVANLDAIESKVDQIGTSSFDSLRVLRVGGDGAWLDLWAGATRSATTSVSLKLSQGLPALGASADAADPGRPGEQIDFTKVNVEVSRTQALFSPWQLATVAVRAAAAGQFSRSVLPPVEKFYLGGATFNRGFYAGQVTGDSALTATAEAQLDTPLTVPDSWSLTPTAQFYAFYDWGRTWESRPTDADRTLQSAGLGVRLYPTGSPRYELDLEGAKRLTVFPNGTGPGVSALRGEAFYWQLLVRY